MKKFLILSVILFFLVLLSLITTPDVLALDETCDISFPSGHSAPPGGNFNVRIEISPECTGLWGIPMSYSLRIKDGANNEVGECQQKKFSSGDPCIWDTSFTAPNTPGDFSVEIWRGRCNELIPLLKCDKPFQVEGDSPRQPPIGAYDICQKNSDCNDCIADGDSWTALGCIDTGDPQGFITWLLKRAIGVAGGIALLLIIFAGFRIITSAGDPKSLQAGKEMLTSAIIGLLVIIFSIFLLQLIGVQILQIPGFESTPKPLV